METQVGKSTISRANHVPIHWGGPKSPQNYLGPLSMPKPFDIEGRNLVWWHMWGRSLFLIRATLHPYWTGPQCLHILEPLTCSHTVREMTTKFCMVIKADVRKIITGLTTNADTWSGCGSYPSCSVCSCAEYDVPVTVFVYVYPGIFQRHQCIIVSVVCFFVVDGRIVWLW